MMAGMTRMIASDEMPLPPKTYNISTMSHRILTALVILLLFHFGHVSGQGDQCPKFRIGVYLNSIYAADTTAGYLNENHNKNYSASEWASEIESYILETLNSAGYDDLEFFIPGSNPGEDMDMEFRFSLYPWSVDKDEIIPPYEVKYVDPVTGWEVTEYRAPVYSQQTAFLMYSSLVVCSPCVPLMTYIISIEKAVETNIYQLIKNLIHHYNWPLDLTIDRWESKHPAPARKPQMEIRYEKEYLSLLEEESRKTEVYIKVKNCHGQYVYDKFHGQPVYFLKEMERLEYKDDPGNRCQIGLDWGIFSTVFTSKEFEAIGVYRVKKGVETSIEKPRFKTCGIGTNSLIEHEGEIIVLGLELQVEPDRKTIYNGEKTAIQIDLHEIDPDGTEILSCAGKEVDVKVTGLVDGTVSHKSGMVTLNEVGVAFIEYKAGQQDKQIKITATFTPPKYSEELKTEATISVKPLEYEATLTIKGRYIRNSSSSYSKEDANGVERGRSEVNEIQEASFYVPLEFERADDIPMFNQRWEYYRPLDINLSSCNISYREIEHSSANSNTNGFETTMTRNKMPMGLKIAGKETLLQIPNIILVIDKEINKVVEIITGGYAVEFYWNEKYKLSGESWNDKGKTPINESENKTHDIQSQYTAGPVEDPIPDPTMKSVSESLRTYLKDLGTPLPANVEIPEDEEKAEIQSDLLVEFGDGKTFFGGDGKVIMEDKQGPDFRIYSEKTFYWQVTRKKKP